jgi:three-Cys-motif partner protein
VCFFIEADKANAAHLEATLAALKADGKIPTKCKWRVMHGDFDEGLTKVLDYVDEQKKRLAPAFVMVDPFGVSHTPMSVIKRLFTNDKVEVYVSFMYEWVNRFKKSSAFEPHLDELFGTDEWRDGLAIEDPQARKTFFFDLYEDQLRKAGANYVVRFELFSGNRLKYAIFFATGHLLGADKMKQAIWKIAPTGDYAFRGGRSEQLALDLAAPDFGPLRSAIKKFLGSREVDSWVTVEEVAEFVVANTDYHSSQFKTNALKLLEAKGKIEVDSTSRTKKGSYPKGTRLRLARD